MAITKELETVIQICKDLNQSFSDQNKTIDDLRADYQQASSGLTMPDNVARSSISADGVSAEWFVPQNCDEQKVLLYLHGGGYILCSTETHSNMIARIAQASGIRALGINYRLAPEFPFPAAVEDSVKSYKWLLDSGVPAQNIIIGGDSAGGGLTVATLVSLREQNVELPAAAVCLSPWIDMEATGKSMETKKDVDPSVSKDALLLMAGAYLGDANPKLPLASPLHADLSGLPPMLIQVGSAETLLDDSIRLEEKLRLVNVDVTIDIWEDMIHCWQIFAPILPEGQSAINVVGDFIQKHL